MRIDFNLASFNGVYVCAFLSRTFDRMRLEYGPDNIFERIDFCRFILVGNAKYAKATYSLLILGDKEVFL